MTTSKRTKKRNETITVGYHVYLAYRNLLYVLESFNKTGSAPCDVLDNACRLVHEEHRKYLNIKPRKP